MCNQIEDKTPYAVLSSAVLARLDLAKTRLKEDPDFSLAKQHRAYHFLRTEANKHSVAMELPNGQKRGAGRTRRIAERNLHDAQLHFRGSYNGVLTTNLLMETVEFIEPDLKPVRYRSPEDVGFTFSQGDGVIYSKKNIPERMEAFVNENKSLKNSVERALHSNFHVPMIHPFYDGNGRLARLVGNEQLDFDGWPSIVIERLERDDYLDLLRAAHESYKRHECLKPAQTHFFGYLAYKLQESLTLVENRLGRTNNHGKNGKH